MQILPMTFKPLNSSQSNLSGISNSASVDFRAKKLQFVSVSPVDFKKEASKKLYSNIQKFIKLVGDSGSIKDAVIMREKGRYFNSKTIDFFDADANILLSINKTKDNMHLNLKRKYSETSKGVVLLDATFNKDGQMVQGKFPLENMNFERYGANVRRMVRDNGTVYKPVDGNDREWDSLGGRFPSASDEFKFYGRPINSIEEDTSDGGAFEIFIELARLYTSILK